MSFAYFVGGVLAMTGFVSLIQKRKSKAIRPIPNTLASLAVNVLLQPAHVQYITEEMDKQYKYNEKLRDAEYIGFVLRRADEIASQLGFQDIIDIKTAQS